MATVVTDVNILQEAEQFSEMIVSSDVFQHYIQIKQDVQHDKEAQAMIHDFQALKEKYEDVQRFGKYHPNFHEISRDVREFKRKLDTHPLISAYKVAEKELEDLLNEISQTIAFSVSKAIKVPTGNPFFDQASSCSGGCGSGGSCGCN
ncbi:YlbF family regulator [Salipaludibacillus sp. LMS25]|jgi:cell fate (sporulation/competence/biofilm development) regulator YlbF (YheA/YmcA/DUF963 family)|uniref:YlbF family regulator n=1 Tax=Salipaludibacillus sp. LMS25 TaxID=2924031 RepID=UPI0020D08659|nr:YlbF family regulator [Salipaludibacillus sp. LMS25]UTR15209.1 YlbF family regulator [Salipaludibacillus sp. LMS25]